MKLENSTGASDKLEWPETVKGHQNNIISAKDIMNANVEIR